MDVYIEFDHIDMWSQIDKGSEAIWIICEETYDVKNQIQIDSIVVSFCI